MVNMVFLPLLKEGGKKENVWRKGRKGEGRRREGGRKKGKALGSNSVGSDLQTKRLWPPNCAPRADRGHQSLSRGGASRTASTLTQPLNPRSELRAVAGNTRVLGAQTESPVQGYPNRPLASPKALFDA